MNPRLGMNEWKKERILDCCCCITEREGTKEQISVGNAN